jgi:Glycosyl hydrolase family 26
VSEMLVPTCGVLWGAAPREDGDGLVAATAAVEERAGRPLDLVHTYHDFSGRGDNGAFPTDEETALIESGHLLHFGWSTSRYGLEPDHVDWPAVAAGEHDALIDRQAERLVAMERRQPGIRYFIDFDHEPDGRHEHGRPADYVAAHRHVRERLERAGVAGAVWVWVMQNDVEEARVFYPGDDQVDWIGFDPYNWVDCDDHTDAWLSFEEMVDPTYVQLVEATWHEPKPLMLAEFGTVEGDRATDKRDWLASVPAALGRFDDLAALQYFDNSVQTPGCEWGTDSSPMASDGFRAAGTALPEISR